MLFVEVLVVHFVGATYGTQVNIVGMAQPAEALVNENIVYKEVCHAVNGDT